MAASDGYSYSKIEHHLQLFINPMNDEPLVGKMEDNYGKLWELKEHTST